MYTIYTDVKLQYELMFFDVTECSQLCVSLFFLYLDPL